MAFWNDPSSLLPKQSHRWVIYLGAEQDIQLLNEQSNGDTIPHFFAKSADRPSYKIDSVKAKYLYSHTFNFPTRLQWNPIKLEFNDILITDPGPGNQFKNFIIDPKLISIEGLSEQVASNEAPKKRVVGVEKKTKVTTWETADSKLPGFDEPLNVIKYDEPLTLMTTDTTEFKIKEIETRMYQKSTQLFFYQFLQKCGYFDPNEITSEDEIGTFRSYHFKKNMVRAISAQNVNLLDNNNPLYDKDYIILAELDGDGTVTEYWKIYNPLITDVTNNKLDYSIDTVMNVTVGLSYDWAQLVPAKYQSTFSNREPSVYQGGVYPEETEAPEEPQPAPTTEKKYETQYRIDKGLGISQWKSEKELTPEDKKNIAERKQVEVPQ